MIPIGQLYAVLDHFEQATKRPARGSVICRSLNITKKELKELERRGRLESEYFRGPNGVIEKVYRRPGKKIKILVDGKPIGHAQEMTVEGTAEIG